MLLLTHITLVLMYSCEHKIKEIYVAEFLARNKSWVDIPTWSNVMLPKSNFKRECNQGI